jgi:cytochrome P450
LLLNNIKEKGTCDFVKDFAYPLSSVVIFDLLGIPEKDQELIFEVANLFMVFPRAAYTQDGSLLEGIASTATRARKVLGELVETRRSHPQDDLISALVKAEDESHVLDDEDIVKLCTFLLVAGHETTANLLSGSLRFLLEDRAYWEHLLSEPVLLPGAIDELLRFVSPVLWVGRFTTTDVVLGGVSIPKGQGVILGLGSANHDSDVHDRPDELDLTRKNVHSLAFGHGIHSCLGAVVTRIEAQLVLSSLLKYAPSIRLIEQQFSYEPTYFVRSLRALLVAID